VLAKCLGRVDSKEDSCASDCYGLNITTATNMGYEEHEEKPMYGGCSLYYQQKSTYNVAFDRVYAPRHTAYNEIEVV